MRSRLMYLALAIVTAVSFVSAGQNDAARTMMEAARKKEVVDGDLKGAIEQYKTIADKYKADHAVAADALLRMAECYQKLGDAESQTIYARIVREFADQTAAVTIARTHLRASESTVRGITDRLVLSRTIGLATVSADGRFVAGGGPSNDIVLRDLTAGTDRVLSKGDPGVTGGYAVMSRDGRQVAFNRHSRSREVELDVVNAQGMPEVRRLLALRYDIAAEIAPFDWSPDGKWLSVRVIRADHTIQIALVSVADGTLRVIKSLIEWQVPRRIFFSPDSRYVAYSVPPTAGARESHVFVLAIDGSRESAVVEHASQNSIMGWSPDGTTLLFASDRNGSFRLWTLPVSEGRAHGAPSLVNTDALVGLADSLGVTSSGALFFRKFQRRFYVQVAPVDLNLGKLSSDPTGSVREAVGNGGKPAWSPDGKYLAYRSCCNSTETIRIRAMDTGRIRELPIKDPLQYLMGPPDIVWSSDGRSLIVRARDLKGQVGDFRIDAQTGEISADTTNGGSAPQELVNLTLDGTKRYDAVAGSIVERELASGMQRVVFQERAPGNSILLTSSPNRQYTAFIETTSNKASTLFVMPFGGGEPRELLRGTAFDAFGRNGMAWTTDNRAILLMKANGEHKELWLVPVADDAPRKLDIDVDNWQVGNVEGGFRLRPGGREIAFVAGEVIDEVRALENFLPATGAKK